MILPADHKGPAWKAIARRYLSSTVEVPAIARGDIDQIIGAGICKLNKGLYESAIGDFNRAQRAAPRQAKTYFFRASAHLMVGRGAAALRDMKHAIRIEPRSASLRLGRATMFLGLGRFDEALRDCTQAIHLDGRSAAAHELASDVKEMLSQKAEALRSILRAIRLDPRRASCHLKAANLLRDLDKPVAALRECSAAILLGGEFSSAYALKSDIEESMGLKAKAWQSLKRAIEIEPSSMALRIKAARSLKDRGDISSALAQFQAALRYHRRLPRSPGGDGGPADLRCSVAILIESWVLECQASGQWREARRLLRWVLDKVDYSPQSLRLRLVEILRQQGRWSQMRRILREVRPWNIQVRSLVDRVDRFRAMILLRRYREAFEEGERVLHESRGLETITVLRWPWGSVPADNGCARISFAQDLAILSRMTAGRRSSASPWAHYYRGVLMARREETGHLKALEPITHFSSSRYGWMWLEIALALWQKDFMRASEAFDIASKATDPADWKIHALLGEIYVRRGEFGKAWKQFSCAFATASSAEQGAVMAWKGQMYLWRGQYRKALELLDEAASLGARYAFCWRGMTKLKLGRPREAMSDLDQAIKLDHFDREARAWRGEAKRLGDYAGALKDLNYAVDSYPNIWAYRHRALVRADLRDSRGMLGDFIRSRERFPKLIDAIQFKLHLESVQRPGAVEAQAILDFIGKLTPVRDPWQPTPGNIHKGVSLWWLSSHDLES